MPRKPAIVEMVGGRSPRQRVWEAIRTFAASDADFTAIDLARRARIELGLVNDYLRCLVPAGIVSCTPGARRAIPNRYRLEDDRGIEAPRVRRDGSEVTQGRGVEAMWGAITVLGTFTPNALADIAGVKLETAKAYCQMLGRAGYLEAVELGKGVGKGAKPSTWRSVQSKITGPRAPMITRLKAIYDPNLHQIVWSENADDALEACDA